MYWVVQENIFKEQQYDTFLNTLKKFKIRHLVVKVVPFSGDIIPDIIQAINPIIVFGSYSLNKIALTRLWTPGSFMIKESYADLCKIYKDKMLNYGGVVSEFIDVKFGDAEELFLRPLYDSKDFSGKVFDRQEYYNWRQKVIENNPDSYDSEVPFGNINVIANKAIDIYTEHRIWVVNCKISTWSQYKLGHKVLYKHEIDDDILQFVKETINQYYPNTSFVIDVARTSDGLKIVEFNNINSCGLYAADVQKLIMDFEDGYNNR